MFLPEELEIGTKALQFEVCCEAIDQNFDCGCILKKWYANLHLQANPRKGITTLELLP